MVLGFHQKEFGFFLSVLILIINENTYGNNYLIDRYIRTLSNIDLFL